MVIKICEIRIQERETMVGTIYGKGKCWVWNGIQMEWCIVKVVMMINWWKMRWWWQRLIINRLAFWRSSLGSSFQRRGEEWQKSGCWLSKRIIKEDGVKTLRTQDTSDQRLFGTIRLVPTVQTVQHEVSRLSENIFATIGHAEERFYRNTQKYTAED